jgi:hypothetical protein
MNIVKKLPSNCPACNSQLKVTQFSCTSCDTNVNGNFSLPIFLHLTPEEQNYVLNFLLSSGSLKEMAIQMGNSYPTVRNKLDEIILKIKTLQDNEN